MAPDQEGKGKKSTSRLGGHWYLPPNLLERWMHCVG
jgi:hypothetical protein